MIPHMGTTVGVELEYVGSTDLVAEHLAQDGLCNAEQHSYHCNCVHCDHHTGLLWRYQRDSTVSGEFITRILTDWPTARLAFDGLERALTMANQEMGTGGWGSPARTSMSTGLHVHVNAGLAGPHAVFAAYLFYERFLQRLGAGMYADKREGMNMTALNTLREQGCQPGEMVMIRDASTMIRQQIDEDRHVDINWNRGLQTYEFRVYNSVMEAWQMELAVRLTLAFMFSLSRLQFPSEIRIPARALATLRPPMAFEDFLTALYRHDPELPPLVERALEIHPRRVFNDPPQPELEAPPMEEPQPLVDDRYDEHGAIRGCECDECEGTRAGTLLTCECDECEESRAGTPLPLDDDPEFEELLNEEEQIQARRGRRQPTFEYIIDDEPEVIDGGGEEPRNPWRGVVQIPETITAASADAMRRWSDAYLTLYDDGVRRSNGSNGYTVIGTSGYFYNFTPLNTIPDIVVTEGESDV